MYIFWYDHETISHMCVYAKYVCITTYLIECRKLSLFLGDYNFDAILRVIHIIKILEVMF